MYGLSAIRRQHARLQRVEDWLAKCDRGPMKLLPGARILTVIAMANASAAVAKGDVTNGKLVFAQCAVCHKIDKTGKNGIGPNLYGVVGRTAASVPGFTYSPALIKLKQPWTVQRLDAFIARPSSAVPGTRMPFAGVSDPAKREDVIAYLIAASR